MVIRFETTPEIRWVLINRQSGFILRGLDKDTIVYTIHPDAPASVAVATVNRMMKMNQFYETADWIVQEEKPR
jgi:hypothetical protein